MSASVLVTGASGYIGYKLCESLVKAGEEVRVVLRKNQTGPWQEVVEADLSHTLPVDLMSDIKTVYHLAGKAHAIDSPAQDENEYFSINTDSTKNLLLAAEKAGVDNFIYFSSVKALREHTNHCLDEKAEAKPETAYGRSKLAAEECVLESGLPKRIVIRPGMVYGPQCKGNLPRLIKYAKSGFVPALPETNNQRSMISIDDLVTTSMLLAKSTVIGSAVFHLTEPKAYSTNEIMEAIYTGLEKQPPKVTLPRFVLTVFAKLGDVITKLTGKQFVINTVQLQKIFGSACYSSKKIQSVPGVTLKNRLLELMPSIIRSL